MSLGALEKIANTRNCFCPISCYSETSTVKDPSFSKIEQVVAEMELITHCGLRYLLISLARQKTSSYFGIQR